MSENVELLRLRDKFHELEKAQWGTHELARSIGSGVGELRDRLATLEERVDGMTEAEKIATAVATALRQDRRRYFNGWRRIGAGFAAVILLVPALHDFVLWIG